MDLADRIYKYGISADTDEYGLVPSQNVEYLVARALRINTLGRSDGKRGPLLYKIDGRVMLGQKELARDNKTFYKLIRGQLKYNQAVIETFFEILPDYLPELNKNMYYIGGGHVWDAEKGHITKVGADERLAI